MPESLPQKPPKSLNSRVDKELRAKLERDAGFPRGPAGRVIALNHMRNSGRYSPEQIEQAKAILMSIS